MNLENLSLSALYEVNQEAATMRLEAKKLDEAVQRELSRRYTNDVEAAMAEKDDGAGTVTLKPEEGIRLKVECRKTVTWDTAKLQGVAKDMPWEEAGRLFDVKISVPERTYKVMDPETQRKVDAARTVKISEPKYTIEAE